MALPIFPAAPIESTNLDLLKSSARARERLFVGADLYGRYEPWDFESWRFKPHWTSEGRNEDAVAFKWTTSSEGFFTPDAPAPSTPQIVVMGDSFLSMQNVTTMIPHALKKELKLPVYSLSCEGWGPDNYGFAYEKLGRDRNAKAVVVFTFLNDLVVDAELHAKWEASGREIPYLQFYMLENLSDKGYVNAANTFLDRHSFLWNWMKFAFRQISFFRSASAAARLDDGRMLPLLHYQPDPSKAPIALDFYSPAFFDLDPEKTYLYDSPLSAHKNYFAAVKKLRDSITRSGHKMLLVWIPSFERVYAPLLSDKERKLFVSTPSGKIDSYERLLTDFTRREKIRFLDLTPAITEAARKGDKLFSANDHHLSSFGNEVAAKAVARALSTH